MSSSRAARSDSGLNWIFPVDRRDKRRCAPVIHYGLFVSNGNSIAITSRALYIPCLSCWPSRFFYLTMWPYSYAGLFAFRLSDFMCSMLYLIRVRLANIG